MAAPIAPTPGLPDEHEVPHWVAVTIGLVVLTLALVTAFVVGANIIFLFFIAVLLALLLRGVSNSIARRTGLSEGWSYGILVTVVIAAVVAGLYLFGAKAANQFNDFLLELPEQAERAQATLRKNDLGNEVLSRLPPPSELFGDPSQYAAMAGRVFAVVLTLLGKLAILSVMALYLGGNPRVYLDGAIRLVPVARRRRAREVMAVVGTQLQAWMIGRLIAIVSIGVIVTAGLALAGVPNYFVLGIVAAVLSIIPFLGPVLGAIPGVVVALSDSPETAGWAILVYTVAQLIDNYVVTPIAIERTVHMPPALTIAAIAFFGTLFGTVGILVADPLAVLLKSLVQLLYVEDVLGEDSGIEVD